jgi:predicted RND superfamily exporter protein
VVQYREQLSIHPQWTQRELVYETVRHMAKPCLYATMTTIVAFASLVVSGIRPVIDFGWMMTLGVMVSLVLSFIFIPAGLLLLKKPQIGVTGASTSSVATTLRFAGFTERYGWFVLLASVALAGLSGYGISQLKVENRFIDYFNESTEIYQGMEVIDAQLGGTIPLEIIIDADPDDLTVDVDAADLSAESTEQDDEWDDAFGDDFEDDFASEGENTDPSYWFNRAGLKRIEDVHNYIDSLEETGKVMSLGTINKVLEQLSPGIDDIQLALIQKKLPASIADTVLNPYLKEDLDQTRITVRVMETSRSLERDRLLKQIRSHLVNELGFKDEQVHLSGMLVLYNNMLQSLYRSQILTIGAVFVAIGIMFVVLFRSFSLAVLALAPTMLAAAMVLGAMGLIGIPLDIMTVTIAAIAVGIGVDDTIHYVHRFREEFAIDRNYIATMYRCHGSIGKAMFYTSVVIIIGFSILSLSNFNPSIYFGLLTGAAMFAALMGALLLLPQLIITFKPFGKGVESSAGG